MKTANDDMIQDSVKGSEGESVKHQITMSDFSCVTSSMQKRHSRRDLKGSTVGICFQNEKGKFSGQFVLLSGETPSELRWWMHIVNEIGHRFL